MTEIRLRYQTLEFGDTDIHLCTLRDNQQYADPEGVAEKCGIGSAIWPLFGVVWPSGLALAHYMNDYDVAEKRILEIGCGIGLPSLLLNKKKADITATDYHPEAEYFLHRNARLNQGEAIDFERVSWADANDHLGLFDLIIGSDLLYEDQHIQQLADFIQAHAKRSCEVILVDPGRGRKTKLSKQLSAMGFRNSRHGKAPSAEKYADFDGYILTFEKRQATA